MKKNFVISIFLLFISVFYLNAQQTSPDEQATSSNENFIEQQESSSLFRKGDSWTELRFGVNFDSQRTDFAYDPLLFRVVPKERQVDHSYFVGFSYSEFLTNSFMMGGELNYAYQDAPSDPGNFSSVSQIGISINLRKYFLPIKNKFVFFANLNSGLYFFELDDPIDNRENYIRVGLDFGVSYMPNERLQISLFMPDIATYVSQKRNFDAAYVGGINFMHNRFFKYPMIGVSYRLENIKHIFMPKDENYEAQSEN